MIPAEPGRQVLADLVVDPLLEAVVDEPADEAAGDRTGGRGREERRRSEANGDADAAAPADPLRPTWSRGLLHVDRAVFGVRDEDRPLDRDLLVLDELGERVEVLVAVSMSR